MASSRSNSAGSSPRSIAPCRIDRVAARRGAAKLTSPKELITFREAEAEGAGAHCHEGAMSLFHQRTFDWLDTTLS
ncbi:MAG TPA: hypothetical protein VG756_18800 [Pseudonocardiaceae bacterium]|nr:hypothetical protein [Pseudonocardiaceae bacterium]